MSKGRLHKSLKPFFKIVHDKRGCFALCILYNKESDSFYSGVALVHKNDQMSVNWKFGKNLALQRALHNKNNPVKRFPKMTFTADNGEMHFQRILPSAYHLHLEAMTQWQSAQNELMKFYHDEVKEEVRKLNAIAKSAIPNAKDNIVMKMKPMKTKA